MPFLDFTAGQTLTAAQVDDYLMRQTVMVFDDSTARSSALGTVVAEGMISYLKDTNAVEKYTGSAWEGVDTAPAGGTAGQAYVSNGTATPSFGDVNSAFIQTAATAITAAYTATVNEKNEYIIAGGTVAYTVTIPDVLDIGDQISVLRTSSGTVSLAAGTGVTTWAGAGTAGTTVVFKIDQQYNGASIIKYSANSYAVVGKVAV